MSVTSAKPLAAASSLGGSAFLLGLAYLGFISLGLPDAALGVAWPSLRTTFGLPQSGLGAILIAYSLGFFLSSTMAGHLLQRLGVGMLLALSTTLVTLALAGFSLAPGWSWLLASAVLLGSGSGAIDAGLNAYAAGHFSARHMNWLHAAYGFGAMLGPFVMTAVLAQDLSWRAGYAAIAAALLVMAALFFLTHRAWQGDVRGASLRAGSLRSVLRRPLVGLQVLIFFVYTGVELTAGQWCFTLLSEGRGLAPTTASVWAGLFWASLFLGRLVLGLVAERVGPDRLVRLGSSAALAGSLLLALAPTAWGLAGLLLLGFALAPIYPMLMARTPDRLGGEVALHAVGFQVSAAMLGGLAWPALGGLLADRFGLEATAALVAAGAAGLWLLHEALLRISPQSRGSRHRGAAVP
jgi:fucose permease